MQILNLGIAGRNLSTGAANTPDTQIRAPERPDRAVSRTRSSASSGCVTFPPMAPCAPAAVRLCGNGSAGRATDYWPNVALRCRAKARGASDDNPATLYLGGVMHYVELDVNNLRDGSRAIAARRPPTR